MHVNMQNYKCTHIEEMNLAPIIVETSYMLIYATHHKEVVTHKLSKSRSLFLCETLFYNALTF